MRMPSTKNTVYNFYNRISNCPARNNGHSAIYILSRQWFDHIVQEIKKNDLFFSASLLKILKKCLIVYLWIQKPESEAPYNFFFLSNRTLLKFTFLLKYVFLLFFWLQNQNYKFIFFLLFHLRRPKMDQKSRICVFSRFWIVNLKVFALRNEAKVLTNKYQINHVVLTGSMM